MANAAAQELGKKGGQAKSEAKTKAARKNASKPRRGKWVTAIVYKVRLHSGKAVEGLLLVTGKIDQKYIEGISGEDTFIQDLIAEDLIEIGYIAKEQGSDPYEFLDGVTRRWMKV